MSSEQCEQMIWGKSEVLRNGGLERNGAGSVTRCSHFGKGGGVERGEYKIGRKKVHKVMGG